MLDLISIGTISIDLYFSGDSLDTNTKSFVLDLGKKYKADALHEGVAAAQQQAAVRQKAGVALKVPPAVGKGWDDGAV